MARRFVSIVGFLAISAVAFHARAECAPAHYAGKAEALPAPWRTAVDALLRSVNEPGHPWSCSGGTVELTLAQTGAVLHVARDGEPAIARAVAEPDDVVPLGQALLASPLALVPPPPSVEEAPAVSAPAPAPVIAPTFAPEPTVADRSTTLRPRPDPRLFLGGGFDARGVGGSGGASAGVAIHAAVPMGRWLPGLSLRQQSALFAHGPSIDELSVAIALQRRVAIDRFELRGGLLVRGAAVIRDLPRPQGEQVQLQARLGGTTAFVVPVYRMASLVLWVDGDVVALSRETTSASSPSGTTPTPFPTFTIGGGLGLEVSL